MLDFILSKKFYLPIIYIIIGMIIYLIICNLISRLSHIKNKHINYKKQATIIGLFKTVIKVLIVVIVFMMILSVYGVDTTAIVASLGVVGVVVGLAFQDILKNLLAGIAIIFDDRYSIGDNVKINGFQGDVISLGLQTTKIKAYTGEVFIIGNSSINEVINYSLNASKLIIDIPISYDIDLDKLDNVMNEIKEKVSKLDNVIGNVELLGIEEFNDSSIKYRMVLDCKSMCQFGVKRNILKMVKEDFNKNKIDIQFNKLDIYMKEKNNG